MADIIKGTFTGTGQSEPAVGQYFDIAMNFSGTASVDVERQMPDGDWIKIEAGITETYNKEADYNAVVAVRLNCTALTDNVEYVIQTGRQG